MSRLLLTAVVFAVLAGCTGAEPVGEAVVELGTGEWRFEPLADEQEVTLVMGSQGGYHVWVSVRAEGIDPDDVTFRVEYEPLDDPSAMQESRIRLDFDTDETDGTPIFLGWPAQLAEPEAFDGRMTTLRVTVRDRHGARGTDERAIRIRYAPVL